MDEKLTNSFPKKEFQFKNNETKNTKQSIFIERILTKPAAKNSIEIHKFQSTHGRFS